MAVKKNDNPYDGISAINRARLESLKGELVPVNQFISAELAQAMAELTYILKAEVMVYIDRRGRVQEVKVGSKHNVSLTNVSQRTGRGRLSGLRCVHTHPNGNGCLSDMDMTALPMMDFDLMAALGVDCRGDAPRLTNVGIAFGDPADDAPQPEIILYSDLELALGLDILAELHEIEKNAVVSQHYEIEEEKRRALLVDISGGRTEQQAQNSLAELAELAQTAGVLPVDKMLQKKDKPDTATFIGRGKVEELRFTCQLQSIDCIIFDSELTPVQMRNLEMLTGKAIIDRSMLILDIFAQRAKSAEGKLQVELAQLKYMLPRLIGQGEVLSRLGGGIGTRGPGETKLEVDRRVIRRRVTELERRLAQVVKTRELHRRQREKEGLPIVALVGYTNAGKSTLLNYLTGSDVLAEDKLFATLDTAARQLDLPDGRRIILVDTVGFVRRLPHHLVAAFRATLEEVCEADLLLHVMDSSSEEVEAQAVAVHQVLTELKAADKPTIAVLNKCDQLPEDGHKEHLLRHFDNSILVSAVSGSGTEDLLKLIGTLLPGAMVRAQLLIPYNEGSLVSRLHETCRIVAEEYVGEGVAITADLPPELKVWLENKGFVQK